jgi:tRNA pseudouridine32 synthase/23S rRNA pseudouridine746 synthase/23S rRNA pseudouridine1911/1915/1917 synthase
MLPPPIPLIDHQPGLLAFDKPAGLAVLADRGGSECLWDTLRSWCAQSGLSKPLLVHRLDKGTSGVLLVALDPKVQADLARALNTHTIRKTYVALVEGDPLPSSGLIDLPLCKGRKTTYRIAGQRADIRCDEGRKPAEWRLREGAAALDSGKQPLPSQTRYRVIRRASGRALLLLRPRTGRTHQLRVHLSWLGWPIVGDALYNRTSQQDAPRLMLHCARMRWRDYEVSSPIPGDFLAW